MQGHGLISLLADDAETPIEPTQGYRFYTPLYHISGAGNGFIIRDQSANIVKSRPPTTVYPPYLIGIMTLDRELLSELLRAFNADWSNGSVFARKNPVMAQPKNGTGGSGDGGLEKWF